jgi:hypothetical protein
MSQTSHDNRRQQIDLYLGEIEELRLALSEQASELQRVEEQKALVEAENNDVHQAVATLEADLKRVRRDAETFGRELKQLRVEKGKVEERRREEGLVAERAMKQAQAQIRVLKEQLEDQKDRAKIAEERQRAGSMYVTWSTHLLSFADCSGCLQRPTTVGGDQAEAQQGVQRTHCPDSLPQSQVHKRVQSAVFGCGPERLFDGPFDQA